MSTHLCADSSAHLSVGCSHPLGHICVSLHWKLRCVQPSESMLTSLSPGRCMHMRTSGTTHTLTPAH